MKEKRNLFTDPLRPKPAETEKSGQDAQQPKRPGGFKGGFSQAADEELSVAGYELGHNIFNALQRPLGIGKKQIEQPRKEESQSKRRNRRRTSTVPSQKNRINVEVVVGALGVGLALAKTLFEKRKPKVLPNGLKDKDQNPPQIIDAEFKDI